jgi:hypothetical protein
LINSLKESLDRNSDAEICTTQPCPFKNYVLDLIGDARMAVTSIKMKVSYKAGLLSARAVLIVVPPIKNNVLSNINYFNDVRMLKGSLYKSSSNYYI